MTSLQEHARRMEQAYGLQPGVLDQLIRVESNGEVDARSPKGAVGLTQLMPSTAKELGVDPHDPIQNIEGGARYLKQQLDNFGGSYPQAFAAYNAGPNQRGVRERSWDRLPQETQNYVEQFADFLAPSATASDGALLEEGEVISDAEVLRKLNAPEPEEGEVISDAEVLQSGLEEGEVVSDAEVLRKLNGRQETLGSENYTGDPDEGIEPVYPEAVYGGGGALLARNALLARGIVAGGRKAATVAARVPPAVASRAVEGFKAVARAVPGDTGRAKALNLAAQGVSYTTINKLYDWLTRG